MKLSASETSFFPWLSERFHIPHSITSGLGVWIEDRVHVPPEKTLMIRKQNLPLTYTRRWSVGLVYAWGFSYNDTIPDKHTFFFPSDFSYWLDWLWLDWLASHTAQLSSHIHMWGSRGIWFGLVWFGWTCFLLACLLARAERIQVIRVWFGTHEAFVLGNAFIFLTFRKSRCW